MIVEVTLLEILVGALLDVERQLDSRPNVIRRLWRRTFGFRILTTSRFFVFCDNFCIQMLHHLGYREVVNVNPVVTQRLKRVMAGMHGPYSLDDRILNWAIEYLTHREDLMGTSYDGRPRLLREFLEQSIIPLLDLMPVANGLACDRHRVSSTRALAVRVEKRLVR